MCGVAGLVRPGGPTRDELERMAATLRHRGPDGEGFALLGDCGLGHTRLAVVDLAHGAQPMRSEDGEVVVAANAEIYNHRALRRELEALGHSFASACDVEVIVHGYEEWGDDVLRRLRGMFAFALWDARGARLLLARDRFGEKPLYWSERHGALAFASEPKAILALADGSPSIEPEALARYLLFDFIPAPWSIHRGIRRLGAGERLVRDRSGTRVERWWSLPARTRHSGSAKDAAARLRELFDASVRSQLMGDVPLGVLLSGGVDSTLVAASAVRARGGPVDTFSIGFEDAAFDESAQARAVAARLGTRHHERRFTIDSLHSVLPEVVETLDEPLADASLLATHLLAKLAREHVKVALGGDGADELFGGYDSFLADRLDELAPFPALRRRGLAALASAWPASDSHFGMDLRLRQFSRALGVDEDVRGLAWMASLLPDEQHRLAPITASVADPFAEARAVSLAAGGGRVERSLHLLARLYLEGDILAKTDRASMAHGLELRSPFLDHELAEFAATLPWEWKLHGLDRKWILHRAFPEHIGAAPRRRKHGFWVPIAKWLNGALRAWFDDVLLDRSNYGDGLVERREVEALLDAHRRGRANLRKPLWNLAILFLWKRRWLAARDTRRDPLARSA